MIKPTSLWQKSLAILTCTSLTYGYVTIPKQAQAITPSPTARIDLAQRVQSIPLYVPPPETTSSRGYCPEFLEPAISTLIDSNTFASGRWGVHIETLRDGKVLYTRNANSALIPASNIKILTSAAALQRLTPQATIRSRSLRQWITEVLARSNNSYADILLRFIGGTGAVKQTLTQLGVNPNSYQQVDGSGLSRGNRASALSMVETLKVMNFAKGNDVFYQSLPVAGMSGTLRRRFRSTSVQGKVHAKTGTLRGVRALSGYLEHPEYGTIVFSVMANQSNQPGSTLIWGIDQIVLRLNQVTSCE